MKLCKSSFKIIEPQGSLKDIELAARTCYQSQDKISEDSAKTLVANLIKRKHFAMLEFGEDICLSLANIELILFLDLIIETPIMKGIEFLKINDGETVIILSPRVALEILEYLDYERDEWTEEDFEYKVYNSLLFFLPIEISNADESNIYNSEDIFSSYVGDLKDKKKITVKFTCSRGVSHELVRHRLCSFAQKSTRYCDEKGDIEFIEPCWLKPLWENDEMNLDTNFFEDDLQASEDTYKHLRKLNWKPEQAREILPNALKTEIIVRATIQEWKHIFELRCDKAAHPQMRELMIPLREEFTKRKII